MRRWLMKQFGIIRRRNAAELQIIEKIERMNLTGDQKDEITDIVKEALDSQFH